LEQKKEENRTAGEGKSCPDKLWKRKKAWNCKSNVRSKENTYLARTLRRADTKNSKKGFDIHGEVRLGREGGGVPGQVAVKRRGKRMKDSSLGHK